MSVRLTESRIPSGFTAYDLGQVAFNEDRTCILVSHLTSPVVKGNDIDLVVFVLDGLEIDSYHWSYAYFASGRTESGIIQDTGVYTISAQELGYLFIQVQLVAAGSLFTTLNMRLEIIESDPDLSQLLIDSHSGAFARIPYVSRAVINNYKRYILDAVHLYNVEIPELFLAAIIYNEIDDFINEQALLLPEHQSISLAAQELNNEEQISINSKYHSKLGVCQLHPFQIAMLLTRTPSSDPIMGIIDRPVARELDDTVTDYITYFNNLIDSPGVLPETDTLIDIYNLLRFPKSNILMCAKYLALLKSRANRYPSISKEEFLVEEKAVKIISDEFHNYPRTESIEDYELSPYAIQTFELLTAPVIYSHFALYKVIDGKVFDGAANPVQHATIELYRVVVKSRVSQLPCFTEPDTGSPTIKIGKEDLKLSKYQSVQVLEFRTNFPTAGTDWIRVDTGYGIGWVNARSSDILYTTWLIEERIDATRTTTDADGNFLFLVNKPGYYKVRAVKENYAVNSQYQLAPKSGLRLELEDVVHNSEIVDVAYGFQDGGGYKERPWVGTGTMKRIRFKNERILSEGDKTYCNGFTFTVVMDVLQNTGHIDNKTVEQIRAFQQHWYGTKNLWAEKQCVYALETLGIGTEIDFDDAKEGDFVQFWRGPKSGHSAVFLAWVFDEDNNKKGFLYRSSQGSTNGIGTHVEYFDNYQGGDVDRNRVYFGRLNRYVAVQPESGWA